MSKKYTALKIDALARKIYPVEIDPAQGETLKQIYKHVECSLIEAVYGFGDSSSDCIYVDEEGLMRDHIEAGFVFFKNVGGKIYPTILVGNGLIVGCDDEGDSITPTITAADAMSRIHFLRTEDFIKEGPIKDFVEQF